jgi:hypothetical protein
VRARKPPAQKLLAPRLAAALRLGPVPELGGVSCHGCQLQPASGGIPGGTHTRRAAIERWVETVLLGPRKEGDANACVSEG